MANLEHEGPRPASGNSHPAATSEQVDIASSLTGEASVGESPPGDRQCLTPGRESSAKGELPACAQLQSQQQPPRSLPPGLRVLRATGVDLTFSRLQVLVWVLTFMAYTLYHASRKPLSIVKGVLHPVAVPTLPVLHPIDGTLLPPAIPTPAGWPPFSGGAGKTLLGELDLAFLACYSFGMYFSGQLADRLDLRLFLAAGMAGSGLFACLFGMAYFWNVHSLPYFLSASMLTGLLQSTGWPSVVAAMANWYGKEGRGLIMGVWNAHTSIGNILGSLGSSAVLHLGWGWAFILPGLSIAAGGAAVYFFMPAEPGDAGFESPRQHELALEAEKRLPGELEEGKLQGTDAQTLRAFGPLNSAIASFTSGVSKAEDDLNKSLRAAEAQVPSGTNPNAAAAASQGAPVNKAATGLNGSAGDAADAGDADSSDNAALLQPNGDSSYSDHQGEGRGGGGEAEGGPAKAMGFLEAWQIPGVAAYAFCLFFAKLVAYTFLDWLPFYISHTQIDGVYVSDALAGVTSTVYDVGGVVGGIMAGYLSDRFQAQAIVSASFMVLAVPALGLYYTLGHISIPVNVLLLAVVGFCVNGPYALITCAVSADLGQHSSIKGNSRALSTVTGIIDGTGSLGAGLGPFLTGVVADFLGGWGGVFGMLMASAGMSVLCVARLARAEWQALMQRQSQPQ